MLPLKAVVPPPEKLTLAAFTAFKLVVPELDTLKAPIAPFAPPPTASPNCPKITLPTPTVTFKFRGVAVALSTLLIKMTLAPAEAPFVVLIVTFAPRAVGNKDTSPLVVVRLAFKNTPAMAELDAFWPIKDK